jgi:hypothetical protein
MTQAYGYTVPYEQFLPYVTQYAPDVSEFVAIDAIRNACIEFCERTMIWVYDVPPISVNALQNNYVIPTPADTKVVNIMQAYYDTDMLLIPKSPDELASIYRMSNWETLQGMPQFVTRLKKPEVILVPVPYEVDDEALTLRVALAPTRDSQEIDSEIYEQWAEIIAHGARARLFNQAKQPYFDRAAANEEARMFRVGVNEARIQVAKGLSRDSTSVEFQRLL